MKYFWFLLFTVASLFVEAQADFNFELVSITELPDGEGGNDVWGFVGPNGTEYAIMGTSRYTIIYDLTDPTVPREIKRIEGDNTIWRDIKSWEDHLYVTADNAPDGLLVIDMSEVATDSIRFQFLNPSITSSTGSQPLESCHNLYIDENGFMYLAGCGSEVQAMNKAIIFDLNQDKWNPVLVGVHGGSNPEYAHDLMVRDNIMYSSEIYQGALAIYDVTDKANIQLLGEAPTSFNFTHNTWISDDGNFAFTTDERGNAFVDSYDISDYGNIKRLDSFQPLENAGQDVVPHNTHYKDGYLVTSWYTEGVVITDANRPENMIKVASYDTYKDANGGTNGCWGAYPWLPSGYVLATDRRYGLHVLRPTYERACYLEGQVADAADQSSINGVTVEILSTDANNDVSNSMGSYKTGQATPGTYQVKFTHPQYQELIVEAELAKGQVTILDVEMQRRPLSIVGILVDAESKEPISEGSVTIATVDHELLMTTNVDGSFSFFGNPESHTFHFGAWGYKLIRQSFVPEDGEFTIELEPGYEDDFVLDLGWKASGTATSGLWERGIPIATFTGFRISNIDKDIEGDIGEQCYVTGNGGGGAGSDNVNNGTAILRSPHMFLEDYENPEIEFRTYFFNGGGNNEPDDRLDILVSDGTNFVNLLTIDESTPDTTWTDVLTFNLLDNGLDISEPIIISFTAGDYGGRNWVEAALDVFRVNDNRGSATNETNNFSTISLFPNPADEILNISTEVTDIAQMSLYNAAGQRIIQKDYSSQLDISGLESGLYYLRFTKNDGIILSTSFIIR